MFPEDVADIIACNLICEENDIQKELVLFFNIGPHDNIYSLWFPIMLSYKNYMELFDRLLHIPRYRYGITGKDPSGFPDSWCVYRSVKIHEQLSFVSWFCSNTDFGPAAHDNWLIRHAAKNNLDTHLRLLLTYEDVIKTGGVNDALREAVRADNVDFVTCLLKQGSVNPHLLQHADVEHCCEYDHMEVVKLLFKDDRFGDWVNKRRLFATTCYAGHTELAKFILEATPSLHANDCRIEKVCLKGHTDMVKFLLSHQCVNPGQNHNAPIRWASQQGHFEIVKLLLGHPRVNTRSKDNFAVRWAARNGHLRIVKLLVEKGQSQIHAKDNYALKWARREKHEDVVNYIRSLP